MKIEYDLRPNSPDPIVYNYQWNYDYDALGNRKSFLDIAQNNNDLSYTYSSSQPNRLTNIYGPYGEPLHYDNEKERQGFIGKERDLESGLADHGVRK